MFFIPILSAIPFFYSALFALCPSPCPLRRFFLLFQDDTIVRSFLSLRPPFVLFVRSFPPLRSPPALCIRQDWRIGRRLRSSLSSPFSPFSSVHFSRIVARIFSSPLGGAGGGFFIFHFCRIFAAVFFRLVPFSLFLLLQANSICRSSLSLASGSDPDKTPPKSPFLPENLIILTFSSPKICIYQKKCVPLHRISG